MPRCERVLLNWPGHPNARVEDGMLAIVGAQQLHVLGHPALAKIGFSLHLAKLVDNNRPRHEISFFLIFKTSRVFFTVCRFAPPVWCGNATNFIDKYLEHCCTSNFAKELQILREVIQAFDRMKGFVDWNIRTRVSPLIDKPFFIYPPQLNKWPHQWTIDKRHFEFSIILDRYLV